jgi:hypothetical protein
MLALAKIKRPQSIVRVTFDDGDTLETRINLAPAEARAYYIGQTFTGHDERQRIAVSVDILNTNHTEG